MRSETPPSDLIRSVSRALRLLEEVGNHPAGINPKRLASRCGIRLPTAYHLLRTLRYEGYLDRLPSGDYVLGTAIAEHFGDLPPALERPPSVPAVLADLAGRTGHSAYLAQFVDGRVTITGVVEASGSPPLEDLVVGFDDAAHATALGKALLSTLPAPCRRRYLRDTGLRRFTAATVTTTDRLSNELRSAVTTGVFSEVEQFRDGVGCVAALVRRSDGDDTGWWALGLSHRATHVPRRRARLVPWLRRAAADLGTS